MAATRIKGEWILTMVVYEGESAVPKIIGNAVLNVLTATRMEVKGELQWEGKTVPVAGRIKPGNPAILTLDEVALSDDPIQGVSAVLYILPWMPNVEYSFDYITGMLAAGPETKLVCKDLHLQFVAVTGIQRFG